MPSLSCFKPDETHHIHSYNIYFYPSISGFLAYALALGQRRQRDFRTPPLKYSYFIKGNQKKRKGKIFHLNMFAETELYHFGGF